ncbi:MAG: hypothetical protein LJF04_06160, partial [Gemmatimonadetes bacterium]|nr:hypothetical protein [Gemmatimonadota bacterium]
MTTADANRRARSHSTVLHGLLIVGATLLFEACAGGPGTGTPSPSGAAYDLVIENGRIVDGTGAAWHYGDVGVRGGHIVAMTPRGMLAHASA